MGQSTTAVCQPAAARRAALAHPHAHLAPRADMPSSGGGGGDMKPVTLRTAPQDARFPTSNQARRAGGAAAQLAGLPQRSCPPRSPAGALPARQGPLPPPLPVQSRRCYVAYNEVKGPRVAQQAAPAARRHPVPRAARSAPSPPLPNAAAAHQRCCRSLRPLYPLHRSTTSASRSAARTRATASRELTRPCGRSAAHALACMRCRSPPGALRRLLRHPSLARAACPALPSSGPQLHACLPLHLP